MENKKKKIILGSVVLALAGLIAWALISLYKSSDAGVAEDEIEEPFDDAVPEEGEAGETEEERTPAKTQAPEPAGEPPVAPQARQAR